MKIQISEGSHQFQFRIPNVFFCTRIGMKAMLQNAGMEDSKITKEFVRENRAKLRAIFKHFKGLELLNVEEMDGTSVKITL